MKIEIDQSGRIEETNKVTVVSFSNHKHGSILLSAKDKRQLQEIFRKAGKKRMFLIQTFSVLTYLLIEPLLKSEPVIIIDREYPGYEPLIKNYLFQLIRKKSKMEISKQSLYFDSIGKKSLAHDIANSAYKIKHAGKAATFEDIMSLILLLEH